MGVHPLKYHNCKIKCTWSIILYLYGLYHLQHKFSNYTELCFPIKWEGTEIDFYVYSPPIVQILINFIICILYIYIYVQIGNKISIYLSIFVTSPDSRMLHTSMSVLHLFMWPTWLLLLFMRPRYHPWYWVEVFLLTLYVCNINLWIYPMGVLPYLTCPCTFPLTVCFS